MKKSQLKTALILLAFSGAIPIWIYLFGAHRAYINWDPIYLAEYIAENGRSPEECWDLIVLDPFGPQAAIKKAGCIYEYASLTKDPSACELLMPSSYGLSCVGGARSVPQPCFLKPDLSVGGNGIRASLKDCVSGSDNIKNNACCVISRVSSIVGQDDCSALNENPEMHDQCLNELAFKKKDPSFCQDILNENTRSACEVQTKALLKDPSICSGCIPAITLEEVFAL